MIFYSSYSFFRKKNQKLLPSLALCIQTLVRLSGNFTPSSTSLRGIPLIAHSIFQAFGRVLANLLDEKKDYSFESFILERVLRAFIL
jgi:hypothetical protein